jgi:predicted ATPase/DNA-binding CsgD family transcriptional regulator
LKAPRKRQKVLRTRIPVQLTRFIGREQEIGNITRLLAESRLLTLTGPGGCGKTRLAAAVATHVEDEFEDGAVWVDLASIADESLLSQALAKSIDVKEQPGRSVDDTLVDSLRGKQILLIIDNCEHLIAHCARLVSSLLSACPYLHVLTTSREPLALAGESVYPIPSLSVPPAEMIGEHGSLAMSASDALETLFEYEAVVLFMDRAAAIVPSYVLTPENGRAIADICIRLDGMPLAIELAAARVNVLTAEQIAARLDNRFSLLKSEQRDTIDQRHETLRAAIDWSYGLLTEPEQLLYQRLSVFAAGCTLATAEAVCAGEGIEEEQILDLLSSLVNKSLLMSDTMQRSEARYTLLETLRQYGREKLQAAGDWVRIKDLHLRCFLQLSEESELKLRGAYQQLWLNWLEGEYDNFRAALGWSLQSDQIERGLRVAIPLHQFWMIRSYAEEGLSWLERMLASATDSVSPATHANALANASFMTGSRGNLERQIEYGGEAAAVAESAGDKGKAALAWALVAQGFGLRAKGEFEKGYEVLQRSVLLRRDSGDLYNLGLTLIATGLTAIPLGRFKEARTMLNESIQLLRKLENPYRIAMALNYSGDLARCEEDYALARSHYEESIALLRELNATRDLASALQNLGHVSLHLGDYTRAAELFDESLAYNRELKNQLGIAESLLGFAGLALATSFPTVGVRLLAAAEHIGGQHFTSVWIATQRDYEHYTNLARVSLLASVFQVEQAAGQRLSLEQAVALADNVGERLAFAQDTSEQTDQLTPREREVAILIAKGRSNEQIATELVVSKRTAEKHIAHIRAKLDFTERTQIVRWVIVSGLIEVDT